MFCFYYKIVINENAPFKGQSRKMFDLIFRLNCSFRPNFTLPEYILNSFVNSQR